MTGTPANDALLIMWLTFTMMATLGIIAIMIWAVRSRQFSQQDRARYLPLKSGIPPEPDSARDVTNTYVEKEIKPAKHEKRRERKD